MKPVVLCILDGWGLTSNPTGNAPTLANTPTIDKLLATYPNGTLHASGKHVGLPEGQMGNSEVGHLNIGAGRVVYTGLSLINHEIEKDAWKNSPEIKEILEVTKSKGGNLHFMILGSFGGVHSHLNHFFYLAKLCAELNQPYVAHVFTDGRDVDPNQALIDFKQVDDVIQSTSGTLGVVCGRYYAMDRDKNWDRTCLAYDYLIGNKKDSVFTDAFEYIKDSYAKGITDEFILPAIGQKALTNDLVIKDNDVVVFLNYRPDRARQLSHLFVGSTAFDYSAHKVLKDLHFFSLMQYDGINVHKSLFPPFNIPNALGEVLEKNGLSQLRIAETEKYPHVTHFFDGGKATDYSKMKKILIPSPKVATYDLQPEMSAPEVGEALLGELDKVDAVILNFANPDMVGHSGSLEATIKACEAVDYQLGRIYNKIKELGGTLMVIADHGNAEVMINDDQKPHTAHTTNLAPFIICNSSLTVVPNGKLADVSPTLLDLLGVEQPAEMDGKSLIVR